ncbi:hypothetical protein JZ785_00465 [Alicyclobacillus curvatus]|nr:hypothetical protein JZ785_00465 [Alicyclobacillus curvatus]
MLEIRTPPASAGAMFWRLCRKFGWSHVLATWSEVRLEPCSGDLVGRSAEAVFWRLGRRLDRRQVLEACSFWSFGFCPAGMQVGRRAGVQEAGLKYKQHEAELKLNLKPS